MSHSEERIAMTSDLSAADRRADLTRALCGETTITSAICAKRPPARRRRSKADRGEPVRGRRCRDNTNTTRAAVLHVPLRGSNGRRPRVLLRNRRRRSARNRLRQGRELGPMSRSSPCARPRASTDGGDSIASMCTDARGRRRFEVPRCENSVASRGAVIIRAREPALRTSSRACCRALPVC